jgi:hypothetical protein
MDVGKCLIHRGLPHLTGLKRRFGGMRCLTTGKFKMSSDLSPSTGRERERIKMQKIPNRFKVFLPRYSPFPGIFTHPFKDNTGNDQQNG